MGNGFTFQSPGVIEVEFFQRFTCWETCGADTAFTAVRLSRGDLALQARDQELLVAPVLRASTLGQARHRFAQRGRLQRAGQERELRTQVASGGAGGGATSDGGGVGGHHATPPVSVSSRPSA